MPLCLNFTNRSWLLQVVPNPVHESFDRVYYDHLRREDSRARSTVPSGSSTFIQNDSQQRVQNKSAQNTHEDNLGPGTEEQGKNQEKLPGEELAQVFGKSLYEEKAEGLALLPELAVRLDEIILKGFPEDLLKALMVKFSLPENCNLFEDPKLNELINFVPNSIILRDQQIIKRREKNSASLSVIAEAIS